MIRLFVALEIPEELRRRAASLCTGIDRARWVAEESLHISLRFIGEVPEDVADDIAAALGTVTAAPFRLAMSGADHFGSSGRIRAVWLGVERSEPLTALHARIESSLVRAGLPPEGRKFHPHLTLARLNNVRAGAIRNWLSANTLFRAMPFTVDRFVLFSSRLGRGGSVYTAEAAYPLTDRQPDK